MNEPAFYIEKADEILSNIDYYQKNRYSDSKYSLAQLVLDTELLLFGYSEEYPALLDIRLTKERYSGKEHDFNSVIVRQLINVLSTFKTFIIDHRS